MGPKEIHIGRVSVKECMDCHNVIPTKTGHEKIARCMMTSMMLFNKY